MRARGSLGSVDEEGFGRVPLFGGCCYLPLGCIFRRYMRHLQGERTQHHNHAGESHFMTRAERRSAVEDLLLEKEQQNNKKNVANKEPKQAESNSACAGRGILSRLLRKKPTMTQSKETGSVSSGEDPATQRSDSNDVDLEQADDVADDLSSCNGPLCSICLAEFESNETVLQVKTCSHQFHQLCIFDWLERSRNTDCPCCRVEMVSEEEIWRIVKDKRKERKRQKRKLLGKKRSSAMEEDEDNVSETEEYIGGYDDEEGDEDFNDYSNYSVNDLHTEAGATAATDEAVAPLSIAEPQDGTLERLRVAL